MFYAQGDMPIETEVYTCSPNHHHSAPPMELPPCAEPAETETVAETEAEPVVPEITVGVAFIRPQTKKKKKQTNKQTKKKTKKP